MVLRVHIDNTWTAEEFSEFFGALQSISYYWIADMEYRFAPPSARERSIGRLKKHNATLTVVSINFASPGFTDLAGFGAILSEVRQFLEFLIEKVVHREDRRLDRELKQLDIIQQKIAIAKELSASSRSQSVTKLIEVKEVDALIDAIASGRLTKVELIGEDE
jgi:hypothetical protein